MPLDAVDDRGEHLAEGGAAGDAVGLPVGRVPGHPFRRRQQRVFIQRGTARGLEEDRNLQFV